MCSVHFCNPRIILVSIRPCDNSVLGVKKNHVLALITCFHHHKRGCPKASSKQSSGVTLTNVGTAFTSYETKVKVVITSGLSFASSSICLPPTVNYPLLCWFCRRQGEKKAYTHQFNWAKSEEKCFLLTKYCLHPTQPSSPTCWASQLVIAIQYLKHTVIITLKWDTGMWGAVRLYFGEVL